MSEWPWLPGKKARRGSSSYAFRSLRGIGPGGGSRIGSGRGAQFGNVQRLLQNHTPLFLSLCWVMIHIHNARSCVGRSCVWILMSWRGPDGRSRLSQVTLQAARPQLYHTTGPFELLYDPGDLQGGVEFVLAGRLFFPRLACSPELAPRCRLRKG